MRYLRVNLAFNPDDPRHKRVYDLIAAQGRGNQSAYVIEIVNDYLDIKDFSRFAPTEERMRQIIREELSHVKLAAASLPSYRGDQIENAAVFPEQPDVTVSEDDAAALAALTALGNF